MSAAEFAELSQVDLRMEVKRQFPFLSADGSRFATVKASEGDGVIFELSLNAKAEQQLNFRIDDIPTSKTLTVVDKDDADDIRDAYETTEVMKRQILTLDAVYANIFALEPIPPAIVNISLAPVNSKSPMTSLAAIVTKAGVCEIRTRRNNLRRYDHVLINISDVWKSCCALRHPEKFENIESLTDYYSDLVFTATCWCDGGVKDNNHLVLFCGTRSGLILSVDIHHSKADILFINKTDLGPIAFLKYFSYGEKTKKEFLFAGSMNGTLKVFSKNRNANLLENAVLWADQDRMTFRCLEMYHDECSDKIVVATCKASFFVVFLLSKDGEQLAKATHYVGVITGLQYFENNQFIVCTLDAKSVILKLSWNSNEITILQEDIKNDLDSKTYEVLGMVATKNKVGWLFVQCPIKLFELSFHNRTTITFCSFNQMNPLSIMKTKTNSKIYEFADCAEVLRCTFVKLGSPETPLDLDYNGTEVNERFIRNLKIAALVLFVRLNSLRKRTRNEDAKQTEKDLSDIRKIIETFLAYRRLSHITPIKRLSREQLLSAAYFRQKLYEFSQDESNKWLGDMHSGFVQSSVELIEKTDGFNTVGYEKCVYCEENVDLSTGVCKEEHKVPRCCITFMQIPLFSARSCEICQYAVINDEKMLRQVMYPGETIACPLCDGPLSIAKSRLFLPEQIK